MRLLIEQPPFPVSPVSDDRPWEPVRDWPAFWIDPPGDWTKPWVAAFTCEFAVDCDCSDRLHVSADERYELYLDGALIGRGSERGDLRIWHYETYAVELSAGAHTLTARVWAFGASVAPWAQLSVEAGFFCCPESSELAGKLATGVAEWSVLNLTAAYEFTDQRLAAGTGMGVGPAERLLALKLSWGWEHGVAGTGSDWGPVVKGLGGNNGFGYYSTRPTHWLRPAALPPPLARQWTQCRLVPGQDGAEWAARLCAGGAETFAPNTKRRVLIDLVDYVCAYPEIRWSGGAGARIALGWTETLRDPVTGDKKRGGVTAADVFAGALDEIIADGGQGRVWRPMWWRCGRFLLLEVETSDAPLVMEKISLEETRLDFTPETTWEAGGGLDELFTACVRTLQMCLHETYMDCPYYEQLMYAGDTRLQCLLTYALGREDRLPRKCIELFDSSRMNAAGLTAAVHPNNGAQIIAPFSLWWVAMVWDYAHWRDDRDFVRARLPGVRAVLDVFLQRVDASGLLRAPEGWNFVDWSFLPGGIPPGGGTGGACAVLQAQLVLALSQAAELETHVGEPELAARYGRLADRLGRALVDRFWDESRGLLADDEARTGFSEHAQCLAIIAGVLTPERRERVWATVLDTAAPLVRGSVYFTHYFFEVCFMMGRADVFLDRLVPWHQCIRDGFKTLPERFGKTRSDCHAWSAHPLYHYITGVMGIRPAGFGFETVEIAPCPGPLSRGEITFVHPRGPVKMNLSTKGGVPSVVIDLPDSLEGAFVYGGRRIPLHAGRQQIAMS